MRFGRDEIFDIAVQATGLIASLVGWGFILGRAVESGRAAPVVATLAYGATLVAMFTFSLLNSVVRDPRHQPLVRMIDHSAIYCLIAGTYTPVCLLMLSDRQGAWMMLIMWLAAFSGILLKVALRRRAQHALITLYVLMGWAGLFQIWTIAAKLSTGALILLILGGIIYTAAAPLHRLTKLRYHSAIWHGCVLAAAACHYGMVLSILNQAAISLT